MLLSARADSVLTVRAVTSAAAGVAMMPSRPAILWTLVCVVCGSSAFEMTGLLSRRCQVATRVIRRAAKTNVDNPYPLLEKAVDMAPQFKLGRRVKYGLFSDEVTASDIDESASAQRERAELRRKAAESLTNIDDTERERRRTVGTGLSIVSLVVAGVLINSNAGPLARFGIFPLVWFAFSYLESAKTGL